MSKQDFQNFVKNLFQISARLATSPGLALRRLAWSSPCVVFALRCLALPCVALQDSGPMAHPIRPESVIAMDNFYTVTVYNKGAEVIRMMAAELITPP